MRPGARRRLATAAHRSPSREGWWPSSSSVPGRGERPAGHPSHRMPVVRSALASLAMIVAALAACERDAPRAPHARLDDFGVPVPLGRAAPERIVSLNPTTTEILFT